MTLGRRSWRRLALCYLRVRAPPACCSCSSTHLCSPPYRPRPDDPSLPESRHTAAPPKTGSAVRPLFGGGAPPPAVGAPTPWGVRRHRRRAFAPSTGTSALGSAPRHRHAALGGAAASARGRQLPNEREVRGDRRRWPKIRLLCTFHRLLGVKDVRAPPRAWLTMASPNWSISAWTGWRATSAESGITQSMRIAGDPPRSCRSCFAQAPRRGTGWRSATCRSRLAGPSRQGGRRESRRSRPSP